MTLIKNEKIAMSGSLSDLGVHYRTQYWTFSQNYFVEAAGVNVHNEKNCVEHPKVETVGTRTVIVKAGFQIYSVTDRNYYLNGTLVVTLSEYFPDPYMGAKKSDVVVEEIVFEMKGDGNNPENIITQTRTLESEVSQCYLLDVEGDNGANFSVKKTNENTIVCSGKFHHEPDKKGPLAANVKALVVLE